jgi:hypothetical protein
MFLDIKTAQQNFISHYKIILLYITESIFVFKGQITHNSFGIYIIHIVFGNYIWNLCYIYASSALISCSLEGHYNFYEHLKKLLNIFIFIALCEIIDNIYYLDIVTIHSKYTLSDSFHKVSHYSSNTGTDQDDRWNVTEHCNIKLMNNFVWCSFPYQKQKILTHLYWILMCFDWLVCVHWNSSQWWGVHASDSGT